MSQVCEVGGLKGFIRGRDHFEGMDVKNACYAHAWDPVATKLLSVGGPLAFGLSGNYAAIWE
jgi:WD repeat-containing protein 40A